MRAARHSNAVRCWRGRQARLKHPYRRRTRNLGSVMQLGDHVPRLGWRDGADARGPDGTALTSEPSESWQVIRSRYVVDDEWLQLRADTCIDACGDELSPYYVTVSADWVCVVP